MPTPVKCPKCAAVLDVENMLSADAEEKLKRHYEQQFQQSLARLDTEKQRLAQEQKQFEEKRKKEAEAFSQKLAEEKRKLETDLNLQLRKTIASDYDIELQKKLMAERQLLAQQIRKEEGDRNSVKETEYLLKVRELEKQLDDQRKLAEEMKRKAEQGSMQLQGEAQELLLEELLRDRFPYDTIGEVGKGVEGADCIQTVFNHVGTECGKIIFESKRTKAFNNAWIEKLKADMRNKGADVAILVTGVYPKEMACFGERDGVWICSFFEVVALTTALRHTIIRIADTKKAEENKGEKMQMLYSYLTGTEFRQQIETIVEGFLSLKNSIAKERLQMEKNWKEREKQLDKVLISTSGLYGSIKGIAGASIGNIPSLDEGYEEEEENPKLLFK
jgi:hypothetical protein